MLRGGFCTATTWLWHFAPYLAAAKPTVTRLRQRQSMKAEFIGNGPYGALSIKAESELGHPVRGEPARGHADGRLEVPCDGPAVCTPGPGSPAGGGRTGEIASMKTGTRPDDHKHVRKSLIWWKGRGSNSRPRHYECSAASVGRCGVLYNGLWRLTGGAGGTRYRTQVGTWIWPRTSPQRAPQQPAHRRAAAVRGRA